MYLHNRVTTTTAVISALLVFLAHPAITITTEAGEQWIDLEDDLKLLAGEL